MFNVFTICSPSIGITKQSNKETILIAIDILRAGTTVCTALFNGAKEIIPTESPEEAVLIADRFDKEIVLLAGERNCRIINGFDLGNSPLEFRSETVANKIIILSTTNGSAVFTRAKDFKYAFVGAFVNISAVVSKIIKIKRSNSKLMDIFLLCAGNNGNFSIEDFLFCGTFIERLQKFGIKLNPDDASKAAQDLYRLRQKELKEYLMGSEHASKLIKLGFVDDIDFSLALDRFNLVPSIVGRSIIARN